MQGWPNDKATVPFLAQPYYSYKDELAVHEGRVFKGSRVVIPKSERPVLKEKIHSSHLRMDGCLRQARALFWPNMGQEIKDFISRCEVCRTFETANSTEPLIHHDMPDRPWAKVGTDIFTIHGRDYLVTVDYLSNFWELDYLSSTSTTVIVHKLKSHFARHGIPDSIVSDNGPQFVSDEFSNFCRKWDIEHYTCSPYNSHANGKAESAVKTAKRLLRKSMESKSDPYLALLDHRNTPSQGLITSPAQRLMSRRTKTLLPTAPELLKPVLIDVRHTKRYMKLSQEKQDQTNKQARNLPALEEGDTVRMQPFKLGEKRWTKGTVTARLDHRSYLVETPDGIRRRNRLHLKRTNESSNDVESMREIPEGSRETDVVHLRATTEPVLPQPMTTPRAPASSPRRVSPQKDTTQNRTRSGRVVRPPRRYQP